jgi:hypothetical protein
MAKRSTRMDQYDWLKIQQARVAPPPTTKLMEMA